MALEIQVDGDHYKDMKIQVVEFCHANQIPFMEGAAIKYLCRWRKKNGLRDLLKARHMIDLLIEMEEKKDITNVPVKEKPVGVVMAPVTKGKKVEKHCANCTKRFDEHCVVSCVDYSKWEQANA